MVKSFVCLMCCFTSTVNSYVMSHVWTVMVMSGQSFVCLICCFMSTVNSYGHVWTVICLFDVLLYVHGKQSGRYGHVWTGMIMWTIICLFDALCPR